MTHRSASRLVGLAASFYALAVLSVTHVYAAGTTPVVGGPVGSLLPPQPTSQPCFQGVLVSGCTNNTTFPQYMDQIIRQISPLVLFVAVIAIAFSGVQYMFGGVSPEQSKKAKQRIIGIVIGGIVFASVSFILHQIANSVTLQGSAFPVAAPTPKPAAPAVPKK